MLEAVLSKKLGDFSVNAELCIEEPCIAVLFGKSGAGKSSIVKMLAGLIKPDFGKISFCGKSLFDSSYTVDVPPEDRGVGYLFQEHRLFPHMSVRHNLTFGRFPGGRKSSVPFDGVVELLGISSLLERSVGSLSGGESQRAALGRALLSCTSFLVMDEPLSSLDAERKEELLGYIASVPRMFGFYTVYITHDRREAARLAKKIFLVKDGKTALYQGSNESFLSYYTGGGHENPASDNNNGGVF